MNPRNRKIGNDLSPVENQILRLIPHGKNKPIPLKDLTYLTGINSRKLRAIITHLITEHHVPIGSQLHKPNGYFIITNERERTSALAPLNSEIARLRKRASILQNANIYDNKKSANAD